MAQLCTNAPPITNSALNGSHLHQCLLTHSECTQPTQIKCSMNRMCTSTLNDSNQDLQCWNVHTCTSNASKYVQRAPIQHLCTSKFEMASKTSKLLQSSSKLLQGSKSASKNPPEVKTCTSNKHKTSRSLSMHTINQTSNHATHMCGPITCWKQ